MSRVLIDGYEIDVAVTEEHSHECEVTDHPVETGANISDHIRVRPAVVSFEGIVSDTPIGAVAIEREPGTTPSGDAYAMLLSLQKSARLVTIRTSLATYKSMALQSFNVPREAGNGDALRFRASFKEVLLVTNERTTVRVSTPRANGKRKRGNKPSKATDTQGELLEGRTVQSTGNSSGLTSLTQDKMGDFGERVVDRARDAAKALGL